MTQPTVADLVKGPFMYFPRFAHPVIALVVLVLLAGTPPARAHDSTCIWTGAQNTSWHDADNWSDCDGGIPARHDNVRVPNTSRFPVIDSLRDNVTVQNLTLQDEIYIDVSRKLTVAGEFRAESGARISNDGTVDGRVLVMPGTAEARGHFDGPITVALLGTLKVPNGNLLVANDDLTVNGTLASPLSSVTFSGTNFTNNGAVTTNLLFRSNSPQTIRGTGTWTSPTIGVGNGVTTAVTLANSITLSVGRFGMSHASVLDIGAHTLTVNGPSSVITGGGSRIIGSGILRTEGAVTITNGSGITPALEVAAGTTTAGGFGDFEGPITVGAGTTLSVPSGSILTAANDLTVRGTLSGPGPTLSFTGATLINDGVVSVPMVLFRGGAQTLRGMGIFATANTAFVELGAKLTLASDHRMNKVNVRIRSTFDITGRKLTLAGAGAALFSVGTVVTPGSTIIFQGTAAQSVATNIDYHHLTVNDVAGVTTEAGTLKVQGLLRTQAGRFTTGSCSCHDVQIDRNSTLATGSNTVWNVTGDWTNAGTYIAGSGNTVAFNGSGDGTNAPTSVAGIGNSVASNGIGAQRIVGPTTTTFNKLTIANPSGTTMEVDARVEAQLTLNGDLRTGQNTLIMAKDAQSAGNGSVVGNVRRTGPFAAGVMYTFGSPFTSITFERGGTLPSEITVSSTEGEPPTLAPAVARKYDITQKGGTGWTATLRLHYRETDLNGRREGDLQPWRFDPALRRWIEQPRTGANVEDNWVERRGVTSFGEWGLTTRYKTYVALAIVSS